MPIRNEQPIEFIHRPPGISAIWTFGSHAHGLAQIGQKGGPIRETSIDHGGTIYLSDGTEMIFNDAAKFCGLRTFSQRPENRVLHGSGSRPTPPSTGDDADYPLPSSLG